MLIHPRFFVPALLLALALGCTVARPEDRPLVALSDAERTPDPACTGSWVAAITVEVRYTTSDNPVGAAVMEACVEYGAEHERACFYGDRPNRYGWAVVSVPEPMRCVHRAVLKVSVSSPYRASTASAFQQLALTPTGGVLDVQAPVRLHPLNPASERQPLGDGASVHTVEFHNNIRVSVIPAALPTPADYERISIGWDLYTVPTYVLQGRRPTQVVVFGPDSDFIPDGETSRWGTISLPVADADGTVYDASVLAGTDTFDGDERIDVGTLHPYATAVVTDRRLTLPLPRLGWIALYRR